MSETTRLLLFLCTGNYYRSRFAELLFNARALEHQLDWRAESAGLAFHCWTRNSGPIASAVLTELAARRVVIQPPIRAPSDVTLEQLMAADRTIALCEREHRPMVVERFGALADRVEYWQIEDVHLTAPRDALADLESALEALLGELLRARTHPEERRRGETGRIDPP